MAKAPFAQLEASVDTPSWIRWVETIAIFALFVGGGFLIRPSDPLFITSAFPWFLFASLLSGTRYGFAYGLTSALLYDLAVGALWRFGSTDFDLPLDRILGITLAAMLSGELTDLWLRRVAKQRIIGEYRQQRLDEFSRAYHVLKVSHERLEERLVGSTTSLRGALAALAVRIREGAVSEAKQHFAMASEALLHVFGSSAGVRVAALYEWNAERRELNETPTAEMGSPPALQSDAEIVRTAMQESALVSVRDFELAAQADDPLAVLPLVDVEHRRWGVVAIYEMPFLGFTDEQLHLLAVLGGYIADFLMDANDAQSKLGRASQAFLRGLARAENDQHRYRVGSALARISISQEAERLGAVDLFMSRKRGLDREWLVRDKDGRPVMLLLMPLGDRMGFAGYEARMKKDLEESYGDRLTEADVVFSVEMLTGKQDAGSWFEALDVEYELEV